MRARGTAMRARGTLTGSTSSEGRVSGYVFKLVRESAGLTQRQLAAELRVSPATIPVRTGTGHVGNPGYSNLRNSSADRGHPRAGWRGSKYSPECGCRIPVGLS
jgi:DNA-binding MurR/RpiR family transcriptional regulator